MHVAMEIGCRRWNFNKIRIKKIIRSLVRLLSACVLFVSLSVPLLDPWKLPFDYSRPENNTQYNCSHGHCDPGRVIPEIDIIVERDCSEINRKAKTENQMNPAKNCIPIPCHIHSSFELSWCSFNFASYSSLERPCHPLHIPVGDLPHPHLLIISFLLVTGRYPSY